MDPSTLLALVLGSLTPLAQVFPLPSNHAMRPHASSEGLAQLWAVSSSPFSQPLGQNSLHTWLSQPRLDALLFIYSMSSYLQALASTGDASVNKTPA